MIYATEGHDVCLDCLVPETIRKMIPAFGSTTSLVGTFRAGSVFSTEGASSLPVGLHTILDGSDAESVKVVSIQKLFFILLNNLLASCIPETLVMNHEMIMNGRLCRFKSLLAQLTSLPPSDGELLP